MWYIHQHFKKESTCSISYSLIQKAVIPHGSHADQFPAKSIQKELGIHFSGPSTPGVGFQRAYIIAH